MNSFAAGCFCRTGRFEKKDRYFRTLCEALPADVKAVGHGGFAVGTGNSIPAENYLKMVEIVWEYRGDRTHH